MSSHFLVQVSGTGGFPNVNDEHKYENHVWSVKKRDSPHGEVARGDILLFYCTANVELYPMQLALQARVNHISEDRVTFHLDPPSQFSTPLSRAQILHYVDDGYLDDAFRSCGAQGFNIRKLEPDSAVRVLQLLNNGSQEVETPPERVPPIREPHAQAGSPLDKFFETKLEDWIVEHWDEIDFGQRIRLYQENGETVGQQYDTREVGIIDLLCEDEDTQDIVVIELKRGRPSDQVIGQLARYIGWTSANLAEGRKVKGIILAPDFDSRLRYAAQAIPDTRLLKYQTHFEIYHEPV